MTAIKQLRKFIETYDSSFKEGDHPRGEGGRFGSGGSSSSSQKSSKTSPGSGYGGSTGGALGATKEKAEKRYTNSATKAEKKSKEAEASEKAGKHPRESANYHNAAATEHVYASTYATTPEQEAHHNKQTEYHKQRSRQLDP